MKTFDQKTSLKWNTILWLTAMVLPWVLSVAFASTRFPWPIILPMILLGPMLASNNLVTRAFRESADDSKPK